MSTTWYLDLLTPAVDVTGRTEVRTHRVAGVGTRFHAWLIDAVVKLPLQIAAVWVVWNSTLGSSSSTRVALALAAASAGTFLYYCVFEKLLGQTPGKNACGIRVLSADGNPPRLPQIIVRNLLRVVDGFPAFYAFGALHTWFHHSSQRLGDRFASTVVAFDVPMRDLLSSAGVAESVYSTSEDGYLLEAFLSRHDDLRDEVALPLARQLAAYFYRTYPPSDAQMISLYSRGEYAAYLTRLYYAEHGQESTATADNAPTGPTPVPY